jgi:hypothetical protein
LEVGAGVKQWVLHKEQQALPGKEQRMLRKKRLVLKKHVNFARGTAGAGQGSQGA